MEVVEVGEAKGRKSRGPSESNPNGEKRPSRAPLCRFLSVFPWDGAYRPSQAHKKYSWVCVEWESRQSRRRRVCQGACLGVDDVRELLALVHLLECPHPNLRDRRRCEILEALQSAWPWMAIQRFAASQATHVDPATLSSTPRIPRQVLEPQDYPPAARTLCSLRNPMMRGSEAGVVLLQMLSPPLLPAGCCAARVFFHLVFKLWRPLGVAAHNLGNGARPVPAPNDTHTLGHVACFCCFWVLVELVVVMPGPLRPVVTNRGDGFPPAQPGWKKSTEISWSLLVL